MGLAYGRLPLDWSAKNADQRYRRHCGLELKTLGAFSTAALSFLTDQTKS